MATLPARTGYKALPRQWNHLDVFHVVNNAMQGKINCVGSLSLDVSPATTTAVSDPRITEESVVIFMPTNAVAATEFGAGTMYVSATAVDVTDATASTFTVTHTSSASARTFNYAILG